MAEEPFSGNLEICFNLWLVVDEETKLAYNYMGKSYALRGTDEEKLETLRGLSSDDHHTVRRRKLPDRFTFMDGDKKLEGVVAPATANDPLSGFWDELLDDLEKELPPQIRWVGGKAVELRLPVKRDALCVQTVLLESKHGVLKPQTKRHVATDRPDTV